MNLELLENGNYLATDSDGTKWICKRKPFFTGAKWFVELNINENYEDVMEKVKWNQQLKT